MNIMVEILVVYIQHVKLRSVLAVLYSEHDGAESNGVCKSKP